MNSPHDYNNPPVQPEPTQPATGAYQAPGLPAHGPAEERFLSRPRQSAVAGPGWGATGMSVGRGLSQSYRVVHSTTYLYSQPVSICHNEVHLVPRDHPRQRVRHTSLDVQPRPAVRSERLDYFGNPVTFFTAQERHQRLVVTATSEVEVTALEGIEERPSPPWEEVRDQLRTDRRSNSLDAFQYVFASPYCPTADELAEFAHTNFPAGRPILPSLIELNSRIFAEFKYVSNSTNLSTTPMDVLRTRQGVCQDFAHLMIGALRSLGLAARYVSGYLLTTTAPGKQRLIGADASHAWVSVYVPGLGWVDFDPTNNKLPSTEHITIAWGRDYGDVSPIKGVILGGGEQVMNVAVDVTPIDRHGHGGPSAPRS